MWEVTQRVVQHDECVLATRWKTHSAREADNTQQADNRGAGTNTQIGVTKTHESACQPGIQGSAGVTTDSHGRTSSGKLLKTIVEYFATSIHPNTACSVGRLPSLPHVTCQPEGWRVSLPLGCWRQTHSLLRAARSHWPPLYQAGHQQAPQSQPSLRPDLPSSRSSPAPGCQAT